MRQVFKAFKSAPLCFQLIFGFSVAVFHMFLIFLFGFDWIFDCVLKEKMKLVAGTPVYKHWQKPDLATTNSLHLFSLVNLEEFMSGREKARLVEMGPYVFQEQIERTNIVHHHHNGSVTYKTKRVWHHRPDLSCGSLQDNVTTINFPVMAALANAEHMPMYMKWGLHEAVKHVGSQPFITRTAGQLLFDGYDDILLTMADMFASKTDRPMDKFAWFYKRNGTTFGDGVLNSHTGELDYFLVNKVHTFNGQTRTHFSGKCGQIHGSADGFYPSFTTGRSQRSVRYMPETLDLFSHQACRSITYLRSDKPTEKHYGLSTHEYQLDPMTFANGSVYPNNECYDNNLPTGVQNNSFCQGEHVPMYLSFPHFYHADAHYLRQFSEDSELKPDGKEHATYLKMDPVLSALTYFKLALQINIQIQKFPEGMRQVPEDLQYFPAMWFKAVAEMSQKDAQEVAFIAGIPSTMKKAAAYMMVPSFVSILALLWLLLRYQRANKVFSSDDKRLLSFVAVKAPARPPRPIIKRQKVDHKSSIPEEHETLCGGGSKTLVTLANVQPQFPEMITK